MTNHISSDTLNVNIDYVLLENKILNILESYVGCLNIEFTRTNLLNSIMSLDFNEFIILSVKEPTL